MLEFLLIAIAIIAAVAICILALAATKPARYAIQRSITVQAAREKVFDLINDLRRWPEWSEDRNDPTVQRSYSGPPAGRGAICELDGSRSKMRLEIIESAPDMIRLQANWAKPFAARNINTFTLGPEGNATRVTWALDGENVFMLKVMATFFSVDRMMGSHFESGLASLKTAAEKQ